MAGRKGKAANRDKGGDGLAILHATASCRRREPEAPCVAGGGAGRQAAYPLCRATRQVKAYRKKIAPCQNYN